jgi:hypothetical protein
MVDRPNEYNLSPVLFKFLRKAHKLGYDSVKNVFAMMPAETIRDQRTSLFGRGARSVNLQYIFGRLTEGVQGVPDPHDLPLKVYVNQCTAEITLTTNVNGNLVAMIHPIGATLASGATNGTRWLTYNNGALYDPDSATVPDVAATISEDGPLLPSVPLMEKFSAQGIEVQVKPLVSLTASQGSYCFGVSQSNWSGNPVWQDAMTYGQLSTVPGFRISDMRTSLTARSFNSTEWITADNDTSFSNEQDMILIVSGAEPGIRINIRWTLTYQVQPSASGNMIIRGELAQMGAYTKIFEDFLRVSYPDIINYSKEEVLALYRKCLSCGSNDYNALTECLMS